MWITTKQCDILKEVVENQIKFYSHVKDFEKHRKQINLENLKKEENQIIKDMNIQEVFGKVLFTSRIAVAELEEHITTSLDILNVRNDMETVVEAIGYFYLAIEEIIPKMDKACGEMEEATSKFTDSSHKIDHLRELSNQKLDTLNNPEVDQFLGKLAVGAGFAGGAILLSAISKIVGVVFLAVAGLSMYFNIFNRPTSKGETVAENVNCGERANKAIVAIDTMEKEAKNLNEQLRTQCEKLKETNAKKLPLLMEQN